MMKLLTFILFIALGIILLVKIPMVTIIGISLSMLVSYLLFKNYFKHNKTIEPKKLVKVDNEHKEEDKTQPSSEEESVETIVQNANATTLGFAPANRIKTDVGKTQVTANKEEVFAKLNHENQLPTVNVAP